MKRSLLVLALLLGAGPARAGEDDVPPVSLRVMTFNIRYDNRRDGANIWMLRRHLVSGAVIYHRPDVLGVQEAMGGQVGDLARALPGYAHFGLGRDGRAGGERCTLFYDRSRLELVEGGTFWLSRNPSRPGADWGARLRRICTWGKFRDLAGGRVFFVFNTHWDHQSHTARVESAKLLLRKVEEIAGAHPAVLMGDLNCTPPSTAFRTLLDGVGPGETKPRPERALRDAREVAEVGTWGPPGTFTGFGHGTNWGGRIDYVLVKNAVRVTHHAVISDTRADRTPSDHRPVVADLIVGDPYVPRIARISHDWRFAPDPEEVGEKEGFAGFGFDDSSWPSLHAGEPWERFGVEHDGVGWYRKWVRIPSEWRKEKIVLDVTGVDDVGVLFVNEEEAVRLGTRSSSFWDNRALVQLPNGRLRFGEENLLVWKVTDHRTWGGLVGFPVLLRTDMPTTTHAAAQFRHLMLLDQQAFALGGGEPRELRVPIEVPEVKAGFGWLHIGVHGASDDSGDRGLTLRIEDPDGVVVREAFLTSGKLTRIEHPVRVGEKLIAVLVDEDTAADGKEPGNRGHLEVLLRHESPAKGAVPEAKPPRRPSHVPEDGVWWNGNWYWFAPEVMPYTKAKETAEAMRGKLLTVSSREENDFVMSRLLGLTWLGVERVGGEWKFTDPDAPPFWLWDAGEPNNSRAEVYAGVGYNVNGRWHDLLSGDQHFLCVEWGTE